MPAHRVHPTDKHVGARLRMRRLMLDKSQGEIAKALGLTFQQLQKYEKGANRISASRLQQLCKILNVSVSFFFEDVPRAQGSTDPVEDSEAAAMTALLATSDGVALVTAYRRICDSKVRRAIVALVEQIATERGSSEH
jgi:transcriptional regulator with XRE-family HTH domain